MVLSLRSVILAIPVEVVNSSFDWVAAISVTVAFLAFMVSLWALIAQRRHNKKMFNATIQHNKNSVKPIIDISLADYENRIGVKVFNNGVGPAIFTSFTCIDKSDPRKPDIRTTPIDFVEVNMSPRLPTASRRKYPVASPELPNGDAQMTH